VDSDAPFSAGPFETWIEASGFFCGLRGITARDHDTGAKMNDVMTSHDASMYICLCGFLSLTLSYAGRVTRLGGFSPFGWLFTLGSFVKTTERAQNIFSTSINGKSNTFILTKMCWATFWAIFSQTRLVTLCAGKKISASSP
jgi:hypothetical protein